MLRCPTCGSTDLYEVLGGYAGTMYRCKRCGYTGSFVVESEEELPLQDDDEIKRAQMRYSVYDG
jgi:transposase-like protein